MRHVVILLAVLSAILLTGCPPPANGQSTGATVPDAGWESISAPPNTDACARARVPGGWLVYTSGTREIGMVFLPDPEHKWLAPAPEAGEK